MKAIPLVTICVLLTVSCVAYSGIVDLSPDETGDRIAVVKDGKVAYLPGKRSNIGSGKTGGGYCRYIRRAKNGDLYVTGPNLEQRLFCSKDGGQSWTSTPLNIEEMQFLSAFTILDDDTFLVAYMKPPLFDYKHIWMARSTDHGKTWQSHQMKLDLRPCKYVMGWNADMIQLAGDGTVLLTLDMRVGSVGRTDEQGRLLPKQLLGFFLYVVRSRDAGKTWGNKSMITPYGGEIHLLQLPSGKLLACVRKQRNHRIPGDPASVLELKQRHGYSPLMGGGFMEDTEDANRIKNMFVSSSYDGGYTWVNEQQVSNFMQCSGDMSYLEDGTLVLQYLHRYAGGPVAGKSIRARVSYDQGKTWEAEEYILSDGENYPGGIAMPDGGMISMVPHRSKVQALSWRPLPKDKRPALTYAFGAAPAVAVGRTPSAVVEKTTISVTTEGKTTELPATVANILPAPPPGVLHSAIRYKRNSALIQRAGNGDIYCTGNIMGPYALRSKDEGRTWNRIDFDIESWGELVGFRILGDESFLMVFEPVGGGHGGLNIARSTNYGKTWDVRMAKLDMQPFRYVSGKDNNMVELADGTLLVVLQFWGGRDESGAELPGGEYEGLAHVLRSTDGGRTWTRRAPICGLAGKARLVSLQSGKLLAWVQEISPGGYNTFFIAESVNGGLTWINRREALSGLKPSTANMTQLSDGTVVLQFLYDSAPGRSHSSYGHITDTRRS